MCQPFPAAWHKSGFQKAACPPKKVSGFQIFTQRESRHDPLAFFLIGKKIASLPQTLTDVWRKGDEPSNRHWAGRDSGAGNPVRPESELKTMTAVTRWNPLKEVSEWNPFRELDE